MKTKRFLSAILVLAMLFSILPAMGITASAEDALCMTVNLADFESIGWGGGSSTKTIDGLTVQITGNECWNFEYNMCVASEGSVGFAANQAKIVKIEVTPSYADAFVGRNSSWTYDDDTGVCYREFAGGSEPSSVSFVPTSNISGFKIWYLLANYVTLDKTAASIYTGDSITLNAETYPASQEIVWTSSDESVATVDSSGVVTGIKAGTATVTAAFETDDTVNTACTVTVSDISVGCSFHDGIYNYEILSLSGTVGTVSIGAVDPASVSGAVTLPGNLTRYGVDFTVTSIGAKAFYESGLTSVTIPDSVTSIGTMAFFESGLTSVTIPDSVTSIGAMAFSYSDLTSVVLPKAITAIHSYTFCYCTNLSSVTIPEGVESIDEYAFYGCTALKNVTIPSSVTSIDNNAFYGVPAEEITFENKDVNRITFGYNAFGDMPTTETGSATVKIVGLNNHTEVNSNVRNGQLLQPVLTGYTDTADVYYQFITDDYDANLMLMFPASDLSDLSDDSYPNYYIFRNEAYAAIRQKCVPTELTCNVFVPVIDGSGHPAFSLVATKTYANPMCSDANTDGKAGNEYDTRDEQSAAARVRVSVSFYYAPRIARQK